MKIVRLLNTAARVASRAAGDVEPNPMVGCVLVRKGAVIGLGHHLRYGNLHAEREALTDCRRRGNDPRGATAFVTLEPCCHHGKQPPCTEALIEAGVARVVYARPDPHAASGGGGEVLRRAGIPCELSNDSVLATRLSDPFVKRVTTGLPWVIAKWAQTADGCMTTPEGESPWITNAHSLRRVHRLRARVDAIVTGIGTVLADDPLLTARGGRRVRRVALRVVVEGGRTLPGECRLVQSAGSGPIAVVRALSRDAAAPDPSLARGALSAPGFSFAPEAPAGVERLCVPGEGKRVDLEAMLLELVESYDVTNVMLECGPRLLAAFFAAGLVDEALVYVAPPAADGSGGAVVSDAPAEESLAGFDLVRVKRLGGDSERWYRRRPDIG